MANRVVKSSYDKNELRHWGVKGMKWAEKNQKALPASDFQEKARVALRENFSTKPWTKLEEANAREKIQAGETSPELYGLSKSEIRQYNALSPEDRKKFETLMAEQVKKGAFINGREVLERFQREKKEKVEAAKKKKDKALQPKKRKGSVEGFLSMMGLSQPDKK